MLGPPETPRGEEGAESEQEGAREMLRVDPSLWFPQERQGRAGRTVQVWLVQIISLGSG